MTRQGLGEIISNGGSGGSIDGSKSRRRQEVHWMVINHWYIQKNGINQCWMRRRGSVIGSR